MKAIITGASKGIGKEFTFELAKRNYDLILLARSKDLLEEIKKEVLKKYNVKVRVLTVDLSNLENSKEAMNSLLKEENIDLLINNAGFGYFNNFYNIPQDIVENMINLNITSLSLWTNAFIKKMQVKNKGIIINVASIVSFMPESPFNSLYAASKVFVRNISKTANYELSKSHSNIRIVSLQPGAIKTNWAKTASQGNAKDFGTDPNKFVVKSLKKIIEKGKNDITYGKLAFASKYIIRFIPNFIVRYFAAKAMNIYK